jgi:hypothetical protein
MPVCRRRHKSWGGRNLRRERTSGEMCKAVEPLTRHCGPIHCSGCSSSCQSRVVNSVHPAATGVPVWYVVWHVLEACGEFMMDDALRV